LQNDRTLCSHGADYFEEMADELLTIPLRVDKYGDPDNTVWDVYAEAAPGLTP